MKFSTLLHEYAHLVYEVRRRNQKQQLHQVHNFWIFFPFQENVGHLIVFEHSKVRPLRAELEVRSALWQRRKVYPETSVENFKFDNLNESLNLPRFLAINLTRSQVFFNRNFWKIVLNSATYHWKKNFEKKIVLKILKKKLFCKFWKKKLYWKFWKKIVLQILKKKLFWKFWKKNCFANFEKKNCFENYEKKSVLNYGMYSKIWPVVAWK